MYYIHSICILAPGANVSADLIFHPLHVLNVFIFFINTSVNKWMKFRFKWTSFTNPEEEPSVTKDPDVDQVAFLVAVALWLMEHAHMVNS